MGSGSTGAVLPESPIEYVNMTNAKELFSLQELDLILERIRGETDKAQIELGAALGMEEMETALQEESERLLQVQSNHKDQQLEIESLRERSARLEEQLYDGSVSNPRDLESLAHEASTARAALERFDAELLELSVQAEESQINRDALEKQLGETRSAWESRQAELKKEIERNAKEREGVAAQRDKLASTLDHASLQMYDGLRRSKKGLAVAKVERGLCQGCRMSLPTQQLQTVRRGQTTVLCSSCGRMLLWG